MIEGAFFAGVHFDSRGLLPVIVQDVDTSQVLMHVYVNQEALERCVETGWVHYYHPEMRKVWQKGEASGHRQEICAFHLSCEGRCMIVKVRALGGACEEGYQSCFFRQWKEGNWVIVEEKAFDPELVYPEYILAH